MREGRLVPECSDTKKNTKNKTFTSLRDLIITNDILHLAVVYEC